MYLFRFCFTRSPISSSNSLVYATHIWKLHFVYTRKSFCLEGGLASLKAHPLIIRFWKSDSQSLTKKNKWRKCLHINLPKLRPVYSLPFFDHLYSILKLGSLKYILFFMLKETRLFNSPESNQLT